MKGESGIIFFLENLPLMRWVTKQRHGKHSLSLTRLRWLNAIGFDWNPQETRELKRIEELVKFKKKFGHVNVPSNWPENIKLATWVTRLRARKARLAPHEKRRLERVMNFAEKESSTSG